jgi:anti-sigma regulatory factor (Ser/Thr protein kinase)
MRIHLRLKSRLSELERLVGAITQLGTAHDLPDKVVSDLNLALEEVITNIIRHGYEGREDREVTIVCDVAAEAVAVTVEDDGVPFNPLQLPDPDLTIPLEERQVGGLGVYLVRQLMDEVDYRAEGGRNILRLTKRIPPPRGPRTKTAGADE